jgi:hypothetical protein
VGVACLCAVCGLVLAACGSNQSGDTSSDVFTDSQVKAAQTALDRLQGTSTHKARKSEVVGGGIESTSTPGTPSPLTPEPVESYLGGE